MASLMTFVAVIVLALLHLTQSAGSTRTQAGMGQILASGDHRETGRLVEVVRRRSTLNLNRKETYENARFLGRKPVLKRILLGMVKAEVDLNGGQFSKSTTTSSGSSSRNSMNTKNNVGPQRLRNISSRAHRRVKVTTFIPLNADYHVPKPHPPKNN